MYEEFFGLSGKPFRLTPDAAFFFASREHQRALSFLEYGLDQGDGFVVITGDVGAGKTMLAQILLSRLDPNELLVANIVSTQLKDDDLLHMVAVTLGVPVTGSGKATLLRDLELLFQHHAREGRRVLLLVDEAQNLPPGSVEELRMLSNFQLNGKSLVQIFLLGQKEFRETLLGPGFEQLRQRVIATYHLNPLESAELRQYVEHRLGRVGWRNDPEFSDDSFDAIYRFTAGVPRRINNLCDRLLLYAFLEEQHRIDAGLVRVVSEEIGTEFWGERPDAPKAVEPPPVFDAQPQPLEAMARVMFDKANVQQRLAALERGIDNLGQSLKPEIAELKEELVYVRSLLEDLLTEMREQPPKLVNGQMPRSVNQ